MSAQPDFKAHVATIGRGPRRVLALHCTMAFGGAWSGLSKVLGDAVTLVAPDMPSHGRSPDWDEVSDFGQTVFEDTAKVMDDAPMDVIGHSFGAVTALRLAAAMPERVRSLMLFEPVFFAVAVQEAPESMDDHDGGISPVMEALKRGEREEAARLFNRMWSDGPPWNDLPERSRAAMTRAIHVVPNQTSLLYEDTAGLLAPGLLESLKMPTLVMRGANTSPAVIATNNGLAARLGNARQVILDDAGHMGPITHPKQMAAAVQALFGKS